MSAYTIKNLKEVEDAAPKFGMSPAVEARFANSDLATEKSGLSYQRLAPGERMPFGHKHGQQEEIYVVVSGSGRVKLDDEIAEVSQWDAIRVSGPTMRAFEAGDEGLAFLAYGAPLEDRSKMEMVQGWWD